MWIVRGPVSSLPREGAAAHLPASGRADVRSSVVALGMFDGVHLGHRAILGTAVKRGRELALQAVACTFDPHPMEVLQPERAPLPITTLDERLELIAEAGIDGTTVVEFTREVANIEPEAFVEDVLAGRLGAREVVVGYNHTFGRGARGNPALLVELADRFGLRAHVVPPYTVEGVPVSSSGIRTRLRTGDVERAASLLGRPYTLAGVVVRGAGRGRSLGFPTANLQSERPPLVKTGVYACRAELGGRAYEAVVNVGVRPTFGDQGLAIEAHLLDFARDLYGERIRIAFVRRLRDEMRFPSADALRKQIAVDVAAARHGQR
jgi:riboflavin kinase / FMN adenylyltransferase